jgi:hypothetical protein
MVENTPARTARKPNGFRIALGGRLADSEQIAESLTLANLS